MGKKAVGSAFGVVLILALMLVPFVPVSATAPVEQATPPLREDGNLRERQVTFVIVDARIERGLSITKGDFAKSIVVLKNTDDISGLFTVSHTLRDINGPLGTKYSGQQLSPGETADFEAEFDTYLGQDVRAEYAVIPPTTFVSKSYQTIEEKITATNATKFVSLFELLWMSK